MDVKAPPKNRRIGHRRRVLALVLGVALVAAGIAIWWQFLRPRTIAEVLAFDHLQPRTQTVVAGTITGIFWDNASEGPRVILGLDNEPLCKDGGNVLGDPNASYRIGQGFQTTLHFESYTINGDPAVWAPELACPFPSGFEAIGVIADSVSDLQGISFAYNGTDVAGWSHFEIATHNGESYREDVLPASLLKFPPLVGTGPRLPAGSSVDSAARWNLVDALDYLVFAGGAPLSVVDHLSALTAGASANGSLRFVDVGGNGLLDSGDRLDVHLSPTAAANSWAAYELGIGEWGGPGRRYVNGVHVFLIGRSGPLDIPIRGRTVPRLDLAYSEKRSGGTIASRFDVVRVVYGKAPPTSNVRYSLQLSGRSGSSVVFASTTGNLSQLPATLSNGATLAFADANADGRLDPGDALTLTNVANLTSGDLWLQTANRSIASAAWIEGYGPRVGILPDTSFKISGTNPWLATANIPFWSPALALNGTARIGLVENGATVIANLTLAGGIQWTFAGGNLSFSDTDHDGFLSTGDAFLLQGNSSSRYDLSLTFRLVDRRFVPIP